MSRIAYVNGRYVPHSQASVHIEDRGLQFADGVYEVIALADGRPVDLPAHLERLERSLRELRIAMPMPARSLCVVMREVARHNAVGDGILYVQVNRGAWRRDHPFPPDHVTPSLIITARPGLGPAPTVAEAGVHVITVPDLRWRRRDIKSVSLLPNVMAKQQAREAGAYEAWQVDGNDVVTEGSSTNAWIVTRDGTLVTHPLGEDILAGVTRRTLIELARDAGLAVEERPFSVAEAKAAREAFLSSTTSLALAVVRIDDATIANGQPGSLSRRLRALYQDYMHGPGAGDWL